MATPQLNADSSHDEYRQCRRLGNSGIRAGSIKEGILRIPVKNETLKHFIATVDPKEGNTYLGPGEHKRIRFMFDVGVKYTTANFDGMCTIEVVTLEYRRDDRRIPFEFDCSDLSVVIGAR